ncbi:DUF1534 domain-containing protein [Pseudomonas syringae]|nr:DUF1534 domain-containing protein [Pseudomonas syringae]MCF5490705.1 DUF1534 domain-containing protein [Pseudomonas syringae]MCF5503922.1 DUF1534 domain-containing protein [Pseudomonas syringae]MCF5522043.1 DUF1534 domain-containing protein [Pseudomonas syringae]MCF5532611.1 DUF1534 domain-containing protein [Pseudomonas syringae]
MSTGIGVRATLIIVPTLRVGMPFVTLRVTSLRCTGHSGSDAERPEMRYHAERGNDGHEHGDRGSDHDDYRSNAPRGNAFRDAPRHKSALHRAFRIGRRASRNALPRGAWER